MQISVSRLLFFFFNDTATTEIYTLSLHDALPISGDPWKAIPAHIVSCLLRTNPYMLYAGQEFGEKGMDAEGFSGLDGRTTIFEDRKSTRLNSSHANISYAVFCLKKKKLCVVVHSS